MSNIEGGIKWTNGAAGTSVPNQVSVTLGDRGNAVLLQAQGKDGNCYFIYQSDDPANSFTGYAESKGACTANAAFPAPTAPTAGSAGTTPGTDDSGATNTYYTSF